MNSKNQVLPITGKMSTSLIHFYRNIQNKSTLESKAIALILEVSLPLF